VSEELVGKTAVSGFGIPGEVRLTPSVIRGKRPALKTRQALPFRDGRMYVTGRPENEDAISSFYQLRHTGHSPQLGWGTPAGYFPSLLHLLLGRASLALRSPQTPYAFNSI